MLKKLLRKALPILILVTIFSFHYSLIVYSQTNIEGYKLIRTFKKDTTGSNIDDYVIISADVENNGYKEFGKDLFSIQITKYLNEKIEFNTATGEAIKDTWKFKVLAYKIENTKIIPKDMILTAITKRVDNNDFKIDYIF